MDSGENFIRPEVIDIEFNDAMAVKNGSQPNTINNSPWNTPMQAYNPNQPQIYHPNQIQFGPNGLQPNPLNQQIQNPYSFDKCCEGVAGGFGPMYFNIRDPNFSKTNVPVRAEPSIPRCIAITNLVFLGFLLFGIVGYSSFLFPMEVMFVFLIPTYLIYLISVCCCSDIKQYIENMKSFQQYQPTYDKMANGQGYFTFWIECYHYVTVRSKNGSRRRKVVTHTATQVFPVSQTVDESGQLASIQDQNSFLFMQYLKRFYFSDQQSEVKFKTAFNDFVVRNISDQYQSYNHTFQVQNHEDYVCYTATGDSTKTKTLFYIFTFLGLALPYACIFESAVTRYEIGILKKLTV